MANPDALLLELKGDLWLSLPELGMLKNDPPLGPAYWREILSPLDPFMGD